MKELNENELAIIEFDCQLDRICFEHNIKDKDCLIFLLEKEKKAISILERQAKLNGIKIAIIKDNFLSLCGIVAIYGYDKNEISLLALNNGQIN